MGAVALKKMQSEDVDVEAKWTQNEATKGIVYTADYFRAKITEYQQLLNEPPQH